MLAKNKKEIKVRSSVRKSDQKKKRRSQNKKERTKERNNKRYCQVGSTGAGRDPMKQCD